MTETLISVDIEASGPIPGRYSMLSFGACLLDDPSEGFYVELQPTSNEYVPEAMAVSGLDLATLRSSGIAPRVAMGQIAEWVAKFERPLLLALNASFDWAFVNHYFIEYAPDGKNPFGMGAIDIKAYAMGRINTTWEETRSSRLSARVGVSNQSTHHALEDARLQARLFHAIRALI